MKELKISREAHVAVNDALISIDEIVGNDIAVTVILHDREGRIFTLTDGPPGELEIKLKLPSND
jgi:hypothetical protein